MKQTAVEWLVEQIKNNVHNTIEEFELIVNQAKDMEKKYLEQFYNQGYTQCSIEDLKPKSRERFVDAKDYYNKTFKSE